VSGPQIGGPGSGHRSLRVLYVMHNAAPGGAARSLLALLRALPPGSVEPTVLAPDGPSLAHFAADGIPVRHIPAVAMFQSIAGLPLRGVRLGELARLVWNARHGHVLRETIDAVRPDLVHLNDRGMLQAASVARQSGVPVVMHARCVADRSTGWAHQVTVRSLRRLADCVIAIDESVRWSLRELENCEIVYNPVLTGPARQMATVPDSRVRVTYLGNLAAHKGLWDLLACAERLRDRADIIFQIAGGNTRPATFYRSPAGRLASAFGLARDLARELRDWVAEHGIESRIEFLGHVDDVDAVLARTDVLMFPSHLNGPGRSVFEAGIAGVPAIVSLVDRIEDVVRDGVTGLIVPERDPAALAAAVTRLADDPALRRRLGEAARAQYTEQFGPHRIGQRMLDLYHAVHARRHGGRAAEPATAA
jgi:glycosyltransferase involved in cell wall biosynthesis